MLVMNECDSLQHEGPQPLIKGHPRVFHIFGKSRRRLEKRLLNDVGLIEPSKHLMVILIRTIRDSRSRC
jgi:hypothetical protein